MANALTTVIYSLQQDPEKITRSYSKFIDSLYGSSITKKQEEDKKRKEEEAKQAFKDFEDALWQMND